MQISMSNPNAGGYWPDCDLQWSLTFDETGRKLVEFAEVESEREDVV